MNNSINTLLKATCLVVYGLAIAAFFTTLPLDLGPKVQLFAVVLLVLHALEVLICFRHVRRYEGPLALSIVLTLLFGLLHWKPLADSASSD